MGPNKRIAIDAMGGDGGVDITLPAVARILEQFPDLYLTLVGDQHQMEPYVGRLMAAVGDRLELLHTDQQVTATDKPRNVLRSARQSSMYLAVSLVQSGAAKAMVSAGNTGALVMMGRHLLKTIEGIQKPAILATIPAADRRCYLLDVGANPECTAQQLFEFAVMGSVLAESLGNLPVRVGLLNIGEEQYKGTEEVRAAAELIKRCSQISYAGFIEANSLFEGQAEVVVCDGFVGNVTIKSSAGVANVVRRWLDEQFVAQQKQNESDTCNDSFYESLRAQIDPHRFNGATLLGLQGSIIKSHGNASEQGFGFAIQQAIHEVENEVPQLIADKVAAIIADNG